MAGLILSQLPEQTNACVEAAAMVAREELTTLDTLRRHLEAVDAEFAAMAAVAKRRANLWLVRTVRPAVKALLPRWWAASPASLAIVRIAVVWLVLGWLDGSADFVRLLAEGKTGSARSVGLSRALPILWPSPASCGLSHVHALRFLLWLSLLGAASPASLAAAGILVMRIRAAQIGLHKDGGHSCDYFGPVLLLLAGSPCSDTLSMDALVESVCAAWRGGPAIKAGGGLTGAVLAASKTWVRSLHDDCNRRSRAYSAPLIFAALYLGFFYLSAGLIKANTGDTFIWSWANAGYLRSNAMGMWLRRWGQPNIPPLRKFLTNPLAAVFSSYLFPVLRFDKVPGLLEAGGAFAVAWECLHWYLLLCGPWVRLLSTLTAVGFHLFVAFTMSISFRPLAALQLALFMPWDVLLDRLILRRWLARTEPDAAVSKKSASKPPPAPGISQRPLVWLTIAVGLCLVVGQSLVMFPSLHQKRGASKRCFPFDHGPSFDSHGQAKPQGGGAYSWNPAAARMLSRHMVLHLEGGGQPVRYPVWQAVCIVGGYKKNCMPRHGAIRYWCCNVKSKAYPDDLMKTFAYDYHRLGATISAQKFQRLGKLALAERELLPPGETRNVTAVSFESTPKLIMRVQKNVTEIMAEAQRTMECEELVMRPGMEARRASVKRTCRQRTPPAKAQATPSTAAARALPRGLSLPRRRHTNAGSSVGQAQPRDQGRAANASAPGVSANL
eukprot:jgi/Tetstr1/462199/TSEL_007262.t1